MTAALSSSARPECEILAREVVRRLGAVKALHGLSPAAMVGTHRDLGRLERIGALPTAAEFRRRHAEPRARRYYDAFMAELAGGRDRMTLLTGDRSAGAGSEPGPLDRAAAIVMAALADDGWLVEVTGWWERRLIRAAVTRHLPDLVLAPIADIAPMVTDAELALSTASPWSHSHQLLAAFGAAHRRLRRDGAQLLTQGRIADSGPAPAGPSPTAPAPLDLTIGPLR